MSYLRLNRQMTKQLGIIKKRKLLAKAAGEVKNARGPQDEDIDPSLKNPRNKRYSDLRINKSI